jgi:dephospho-CoA kinase
MVSSSVRFGYNNPMNIHTPYCVGLTGTIASGKSTVANLFYEQGIAVFCADKIAKDLTLPGCPALDAIVHYFGPEALTHAGELNRRYLRHRMIHHPDEKQWLETLLHPQIRTALLTAIQTASGPYTMVDIPLLYDRTLYPFLTRVLCVTATHAQQIERLIKRDQCSPQEAEALLSLQRAADKSKQNIDDTIHNDTTINALKNQVVELHQQYLKYFT